MKTIVAVMLSLALLGGIGACSKGESPAGAAPVAAKAPTQAVTQYYCPMDKDVVSDKPGQTCPKCGMKLEPRPAK